MALTKEKVIQKMREKDTVVLNVLSAGDYEKMHIKGSYNLPWSMGPGAFTQEVDRKFGKDKFFITHCSSYTCMAGPNAAKALQAAGFRAEDYPGGMQEWSEANFPMDGLMVPKATTSR